MEKVSPAAVQAALAWGWALAERRSLTRVEEILVEPDTKPPEAPAEVRAAARECARSVAAARGRQAAVMLIYGAHLLRNGAAPPLTLMTPS